MGHIFPRYYQVYERSDHPF